MSEQRIIGYHMDLGREWVAELECGHGQHVRHDPPWQVFPWVISEEGRTEHIGTRLFCRRCEEGARRISEREGKASADEG